VAKAAMLKSDEQQQQNKREERPSGFFLFVWISFRVLMCVCVCL
jgi:hypothetical protein